MGGRSAGRPALLAVVVLAGCSGDPVRHVPGDAELPDATGDSPMVADGSTADSSQGGSGEVVAMGSSPYAITVDDTTLYWTDLGLSNVASIPVAGGSSTTLATNLVQPYYLEHDATSLYWGLNADTIGKIPLAGGTPVPLQTSNNTLLSALALDATNVYHTEDYVVPQDCSVVVVPKAGGTRVILASGGSWDHPTGMAVNGGTVFWGAGSPGAILTVPVGGGTTTTLVSGIAPYAMAADATNVYWLDATGAVMKVAQAGGAPVTLATTDHGHALVIDSTNVYWATNTPSAIYKVPIAGGSTVTIASGLDLVNGIAVDATSIYWTENTGAIRRAPK